MFDADEPRHTAAVIRPGEDLSVLGLEQLAERKRVLEQEIERTEAMMTQKQAGLASAESLFKKP
ncbi:MAG: DUF1192 domain-containing protein [Oceanicaulis sp.]